ncbi:unnamed protein product [Phytophthora fragariaefolia]|uniref:Unnamed protein product n=1 Tax=Phytophthora fragariaefolia TaxID=1490495 RepID=A0A9W7CVA2_9STRA|nr:unnamed protein product [Phytophthora fragariaefolia]
MPSDRLGGATPLTAFTALPGESQLRSILHPQDPLEASVTWVEAEITDHLQTVRAALDGMHAEMTSASEKRRRAAHDRHATKRGVTLPKFSEGDFVLAATATGRSGNKLALVWRGPKRIVGVVNDYTFEVQDLMAPFATSLRHASRLQLYRDTKRDLEKSLVEQAIDGEGGHLVEALRSIRRSPDTHRWEILVKWYGLDELGASWDPADRVRENVPLLYDAFINSDPADPARKQMLDALAALTHRRATAPDHQPRARSRGRPRTRTGHWESSH